jgi:hypothetical protein
MSRYKINNSAVLILKNIKNRVCEPRKFWDKIVSEKTHLVPRMGKVVDFQSI